ncbi:hypothetical protein I4U23_026772 [Adineta vaga]|nr:hypothetical protein I4U23_026772 [Adineta vaga]
MIIFSLLSLVGYNQSTPQRERNNASLRRWERWCMGDFQCGHGYCQGYVCQCHRGYITWRWMNVCNYEQRTKLTAFLLSFFVGIFGIDWFILSRGQTEYIIAGIIKLLISFGCIIGWPIIILHLSKKKSGIVTIPNMINVSLSVTSFLWWLTDWIRILADVFYDGNGAPLLSWKTNYNTRFQYQM